MIKTWVLIPVAILVFGIGLLSGYSRWHGGNDKIYTEGTKVQTQIADMYDYFSSQNVSFDITYNFDNSEKETASIILHFVSDK